MDVASVPDGILSRVLAAAPQVVCVLDADGVVALAQGRHLQQVPRTVDDLAVGAEEARKALGGDAAGGLVEADGRLYDVWAEPTGDGAVVVVTDITGARLIERRWRALVRDSAHMLAVVGSGGAVEYASPAVKRLLGWAPGTDVVANVRDVVHPDDLAAVRSETEQLLGGDLQRATMTVRVGPVDGTWRHLEVVVVNLLDDPTLKGLVLNMRDVSERVRAEHELHRRARQQQVVAGLGHRALMGVDVSVVMNDAVAMVADVLDVELCGLLELEPAGAHLMMRAGVGWDEGCVGSVRQPVDTDTHAGFALESGAPVVVEHLGRDVRFSSTDLLRGHGVVSAVFVAVQGAERAFGVLGVHSTAHRSFSADDVHFLEAVANVLAAAAERRQVEEEIRMQSVHDALTRLPNRTLFLDRLAQALSRAERTRRTVAVLFLDIDRFKIVNDGLGHVAGDRLLMEVARRLSAIVRPGDTVARFGGDEFVVLCDDIGAVHHAVEIADRIGEVLGRPFAIGGNEVMAGASVGIALAKDGAHEGAEALVRDADAAMYRAKERGRGRYEVFDDVIRDRAVRRLETEQALRHAIGREELRLVYQPGVSLATGNIAAVEALLRWEHPERGLIGPDEFIPVAEETGLIVPLGEWVLQQAAELASRLQWAAADGGALTVAVNLSARQLSAPGLVDRVAGVLREYDLPARALSLEITESVLMDDAEAARRMLVTLKDVGVYLAIDDFGTGYSSLAYLRRFPVDALKVDKSFVDGLGREAEDSAIVRAVVNLAQTLGLDTVAEGVETEVQRQELVALGCTYAQGFLWSPALPAEELDVMLRLASERRSA